MMFQDILQNSTRHNRSIADKNAAFDSLKENEKSKDKANSNSDTINSNGLFRLFKSFNLDDEEGSSKELKRKRDTENEGSTFGDFFDAKIKEGGPPYRSESALRQDPFINAYVPFDEHRFRQGVQGPVTTDRQRLLRSPGIPVPHFSPQPSASFDSTPYTSPNLESNFPVYHPDQVSFVTTPDIKYELLPALVPFHPEMTPYRSFSCNYGYQSPTRFNNHSIASAQKLEHFPPRSCSSSNSEYMHNFNGYASPWQTAPVAVNRRNSYSHFKNPYKGSRAVQNQHFNYRVLLDKDSDYDWSILVARIISNSEQQASIFLQQKVKIANAQVKQHIFDAISERAFLLMINRFGNFLIQRAFEHGTPEQISQLTSKIVGNVIQLATDPYGCHVIQKALDYANQHIKRLIIEEMMMDIRNVITQRCACHVWQKLIETNWDKQINEELIDIMPIINKELEGQWLDICLNASGSLVVQAILENCNKYSADKLQCVDEIVQHLSELVCDQWGNWVAQHLLEYGNDRCKAAVVNNIITNAVKYSYDQYGSSVIEKMFKSCDESVMQRYLEKVCAASRNKSRIELLDIATNVHGSFLVQYILKKGLPGHRQEIVQQLKKHMVYLRSSKWGCQCVWLINHTEE